MDYSAKQSGERIHRLRVKAGYTQETMAEKLDIDRSFYSRKAFTFGKCAEDNCTLKNTVSLVRRSYPETEIRSLTKRQKNAERHWRTRQDLPVGGFPIKDGQIRRRAVPIRP